MPESKQVCDGPSRGLLEKSFSLVKMPSLQPVVMCVMKHLPKVRAEGCAPRAPTCSLLGGGQCGSWGFPGACRGGASTEGG